MPPLPQFCHNNFQHHCQRNQLFSAGILFNLVSLNGPINGQQALLSVFVIGISHGWNSKMRIHNDLHILSIFDQIAMERPTLVRDDEWTSHSYLGLDVTEELW